MAQAAFCSQCNANVYVTSDGRCPQGHGPEALSNHYEVPDAPAPAAPVPAATTPAAAEDPSPAAVAYADATTSGTAAKPKSRLPLILAIIALVLALCGVGSCVAIGAFLTTADESMSEIETSIDEEIARAEEELAELETLADDDLSAQAAADAERMVEHFYPLFTLESFYTVGDTDETGANGFHIIAAYANNPGFRITFFATRTTAELPEGDLSENLAYFDDESQVWWLHPETRSHALDSVFGPSPLMVPSMLDQISADFVEVHPTKIISDITSLTNVDLGFGGIDESELENWYDDGESFESTWKLNMQVAPSRWDEVDFAEF